MCHVSMQPSQAREVSQSGPDSTSSVCTSFRIPNFPVYSWHGYAACTTNLSITLAFEGKPWSINPADMNLGPVNDGSPYCVGAIFDMAAEYGPPLPGPPTWVVGNTFLKNVYTVFRTYLPSVGFAALSSLAGGSGVEEGELLNLGVEVC